MSHIQTLNLLNSKTILSDAARHATESKTADDQFMRLFENLRTKSKRPAEEATSASRMTTERAEASEEQRGESRLENVQHDRASASDRADERTRERERPSVERREKPDRQSLRDDAQAAGRTRDADDRSIAEDKNGRPSAQDEPHNGGSSKMADDAREQADDDGRGAGADAPEPRRDSGSPTDQSAQPEESPAEPVASGSESQNENATSNQEVVAQVVQQTTQAVAAMGAGSTAEAAGQTQPSATAHADTTGQSPAASAGTPIDASTKPQTEPSTAPQRQEATLGGSPDSTAASQTNRSTPIQESPLQQAQQQPAAAEGVAKPEQTRTDAARPATADAVPPQGERSSAAVARADSQSGSSSGRPQTEGHGQEHGGTATPDRTPQIDNRIASAQARFAEPELTPGEVKVRAKSEGGDTASDQKPQTDQSGSSASGKGFITRIWTGPDRAEVSSAASQDPNGNHRNQALAAEATRQIARFIAEPRTRGDATSTRSEMVSTSQNSVPSSGGTSTQTITTPVSDGMSQTPSPTPAVGAPAADGRAEQAVSLTRTDTPRQADGTAMQDSIDRLARVLRAHIGDRESQVRIQLDPPELGRVRIDIRMRSDVLVLQVETETAAGRNLLSSRLNELRDALQQHGIHVERASVQIRDAVSETPQTREQQQHQQPSQHGNQQHGQEAPGQAGDQPGRSGRHDGPAQGEEVPASTSDSREDASAESETSAADAGQASGGDRSASMAESWLDLVA